MLKIWGRRTSSNVQAVMWCVTELGLEHERYDVGHRFGGLDTVEFLSMNPNGTIPVLQDGGGDPIWETGAILRYLAGQYGNSAFWPTEPPARALVDQWAEWGKINVALAFTGPVFWQVVRTRNTDWSAVEKAVAALEDTLSIAETRLANQEFLVGDELSLADIQFGHVLFRYFDIDIKRSDLPHLRAYYTRLTARAPYREHVMVPYDELRV